MIAVNTPLLSGNELKYVTECIETGWISSEGSFVTKFETEFAQYVNRKHGIAVSNGSAALDIAVKALGLGKGDEVIMPTFTIISPVQSVVTAGATPVLVDSDPITWNMDVDQIEAKITKETKAILVVHIYGLPVDMDPILELCKKYNLKLIEDAAEMHGQTYKGQMCGSFGDISIFSFYPNKHITTGEGGMIVCNDDSIAEKCKKLRNLAFEQQGRRFIHHEIGWNYRMTNLQAALGVAQLEKMDYHIQRKREIGKLYREGLKDLKGFQLPLERTSSSENIYWVFGLVAETEVQQEAMVKRLNDAKIGTRPFFWCMHEQPVFIKMGLFENENYPVAEKLARNGFYIPSGLGLRNEEIAKVISVII
ncbi:DegT/DnrJ/EryC1/StrS family aminotransferase [Flavobacterium sufflavum]|nr:DegT/DnrJ/EryC1/StrS family aminotransferase [Flavobacterium sufflavum]